MFFKWLSARSADRTVTMTLYGIAARQARRPDFYGALGVADTMDGRFDLLCLHVFLLIDTLGRFGADGRRLAQALFDVTFRNVDLSLRESGVGDLGVPKHMKKMMAAFNGRMHIYRAALGAKGNPAALEIALTRNIYRLPGGDAVHPAIPPGVAALAAYLTEARDRLGALDLETIRRGAALFPEPPAMNVEHKAYAHA